MKEDIELFKKQLNEAKSIDGDWRTPYANLIKCLFHQPVLFFALSKSFFTDEDFSSVPLISTKDFGGAPSLYVFSDVDIASVWMRHYKHVSDDFKYGLIGAVNKDDNNYQQIFPIAKQLGAQYIMLDEGGSYVGIAIDDFLNFNDIHDKVFEVKLTKSQLDKMLANEVASVGFSRIPAIPLTR